MYLVLVKIRGRLYNIMHKKVRMKMIINVS